MALSCLCLLLLLLLLLKDNPSFNEIGVGAPNRRKQRIHGVYTLERRLILGDLPRTAPL